VATGVSGDTFDTLLGEIGRPCNRLDIPQMPLEQKRAAVQYLLNQVRALIVPDNLEAVPDGEALLYKLYQILGQSKALITSRHRGRRERAHTITLRGLPEEEGIVLLREDGAGGHADLSTERTQRKGARVQGFFGYERTFAIHRNPLRLCPFATLRWNLVFAVESAKHCIDMIRRFP